MVVAQIFFIVIATRVIELFLERVYAYIATFFNPLREKKDPLYKRLSADVSLELHKEVSDMAKVRCITIKEYILGAIMMRLKLDKDCNE